MDGRQELFICWTSEPNDDYVRSRLVGCRLVCNFACLGRGSFFLRDRERRKQQVDAGTHTHAILILASRGNVIVFVVAPDQ